MTFCFKRQDAQVAYHSTDLKECHSPVVPKTSSRSHQAWVYLPERTTKNAIPVHQALLNSLNNIEKHVRFRAQYLPLVHLHHHAIIKSEPIITLPRV